jgi:hypothetical protein
MIGRSPDQRRRLRPRPGPGYATGGHRRLRLHRPGNEILAAINQTNELVRVSANGAQETLLDAEDGMQGTTAVAVRGNRAYVTNGANLAGNAPTLMLAELHRR